MRDGNLQRKLRNQHLGWTAGMLPVLAVVNLVSALIIMLALGVVHGMYPVIPAPGYWEVYIVALAVSSLRAILGQSTKVKVEP